MIGVSVFSIFLGNFTSIIDAYKSINQDLDDSDKLDNFFEMMMHFNSDIPLDLEFRQRMRAHFNHKWKKDLN
jgi:hypothetical protein